MALTHRATLRGRSSSRIACSSADLSTECPYVTVNGDSRFWQHSPTAQQLFRSASSPWVQHWHVVRRRSRKVRTSLAVSRATFLVPRPGMRWRRMQAAYRAWVFSRSRWTATPFSQ
ncbi:hypothetical protein AQJ58_03900 [Streptomyces sp. DSM 15324]|nr:hypothetical protein AQJ58_03900 [Streptomyces sp. DSM 15324]